jgi:hypothetical protein
VPTFVALALDFDFLSQIFVFLPTDRATNSPLIEIIAADIQFVLIPVLLGQGRILEVFIGREMEVNFVSRRRSVQVFQSDIREMTQSSLVSFRDQFAERDVVFEGSKPELGDSSFCPFRIRISSGIRRKGCSTRIVLESLGFSGRNLIGAWFYGTINNIETASI